MKRKFKNLIMIILIIILGCSMYFTMSYAKKSLVTSNTESTIGEQPGNPPEMPQNGNGENSSNAENNNSQNSNSDKKEPPQKPDESNQSGNSSNMSTPPEKPDGDNNSQGDNQSGKMQPPSNNGMPNDGNMPDENGQENKVTAKLTTKFYVIFSVEAFIVSIIIVYLIMSKFNKYTLKETFGKVAKTIVFIIIVAGITVGITVGDVAITNKYFLTSENQSQQMQMPSGGFNPSNADSSDSVNQSGVTEVTDTQTLTENCTSTNSDESAIVVKDGGNLTLQNATVSKESGDSSNTENSEFYGVNAGILVKSGSTATIKGATISTNAKGSNAVFSTGTDSKVYISDSKITTSGSSSSRGLDATYGGYIEADNVEITTKGGSCATLATDRGEGTVIAKNSKLQTNGTGSPVIYSTGDITLSNSEGTANGSQTVVIEGKNSATVENSTITASGKGNRNDVDNCGVMIYQSMSGDASVGTGNFTVKNSTLQIQSSSNYYKTAPMFFITNTDAIINLENTKLVYGSNILISAKGTSEWGTSGSNGGNVTINTTKQVLEGNIELDNISTLTMNLQETSEYTGTINADNSAKSVSLKLDATSKITLTGDSYVTSLEDTDTSYSNINFNGYKLYVNGNAIN